LRPIAIGVSLLHDSIERRGTGQCRVDTGQVESTRQQVIRRFEKLTPEAYGACGGVGKGAPPGGGDAGGPPIASGAGGGGGGAPVGPTPIGGAIMIG
jgi:hypothetical protein